MELAFILVVHFLYIMTLLYCKWPVALIASRLLMDRKFMLLQLIPLVNIISIIAVIYRLKYIDKRPNSTYNS